MKAELPGLLGIAATGPHAFGAVLVWRERQSPLGRQLWLGFRKRSQAKGLEGGHWGYWDCPSPMSWGKLLLGDKVGEKGHG